ncbi:MAG: 50S ribosomal protein L30 [Cytophagales bacterium]|jgi:large subunit ribosomal protein L30|tara:strand:- start:614 stop:787 length:174 start_codon:yes stop_codon:yes gene_type:complete
MFKITQVKSTIKRPKNQKITMKTIGLGKINKVIKIKKNHQIIGMIKKIKHLIKIEEI